MNDLFDLVMSRMFCGPNALNKGRRNAVPFHSDVSSSIFNCDVRYTSEPGYFRYLTEDEYLRKKPDPYFRRNDYLNLRT